MSTARPTVSVIIPTLNEEKCLDGVLCDIVALGPDELIVADGGSEDRTPEIAAQYGRVVRAAPGRGAQMNAGAAAARGDILLFLHADVRPDSGALDAVREAVRPSAVHGGCFHI